MAIKNILENSSRDIQTGSSATGEKASPGWDPATGFGLLNGNRAIHYLIPDEFCPFIRDSLQDTGEAVTDRLFVSPDIIVRNEQVKDPQGELGQTAKHIYDLSDEPEEGRDNYIYLRVQNRGALRGDCTATVYYTAAGLFTHPHTWRKIGHFEIQDLLPGEFRVAGPIVWPHNDVCGKDYCLIATLNRAGSTTPDLRKIGSSVDLINIVRSRIISWRNIDVANTTPGHPSLWSFYIDGAGEPTDLQVDISSFPDPATVLIRIPNEFANSVQLDQLVVVEKTELYSTLRHLGGIATLKNRALSFGRKIRVSIYYSIPIGTPAHTFSGVANLLIGRNKVSAYTKVINVSTSAYVGNRRTLCMHKRGCPWLAKISSYERLDIHDLDNGRERGFKSCDTCFVSEL